MKWAGAAVATVAAACSAEAARAQTLHDGGRDSPVSELGHGHTGPHHPHPHLTHPLVTESPLPENQVRFDLAFARGSEESDQVVAQASVELAVTPNLGLELAVPYVWAGVGGGDASDGVGNAEVAVKFADYHFGGSGLLVGAGLEVELPTGDDRAGTGDDRQTGLEPYVGFGYRRHNFETIGLLRFGVPLNERAADAADVDLELAADVSLLYHLTPRLAGLLEFNGAAVVAGESDETLLTISPGVSLDPTGTGDVRVGFGLSLPVTDDAGFDYEARTMVVAHF